MDAQAREQAEHASTTSAEVPQLQVVLTGKRLLSCSDEELVSRLQAKFKLSAAQSAAMLKGRCIVKRGINAAAAEKFVAALNALGLHAVAEEIPSRATPSQLDTANTPRRAPHPQPLAMGRPTLTSAKPVAATTPPTPIKDLPNAAPPLDALRALASQRLPRPRISFSYSMGLLLVTLLCVALPVIYVGLTGGIALGWIWYLTHIHEHLPRSAHLVALIYAVPGLVGAVLVLFLIRPLFAPRPPRRETLELDAKKEAGFVSGVHALCRAIGVSPPIEIRLSWDANASVHFRTRWLSLLTGHKVLTIGTSLAAGLSARQLVGVLAHEFGHFAQRFGMICSFTVNSVNAWLEHCAYGEDAWDHKLRKWSNAALEKEHWFSWIVNWSIAASWIAIRATRLLMAGLFQISLRLSQYMSRQMEFDADRYEALLAGSTEFRTTARSLRALNHAFYEVNQANIDAWQEHRLLRDLPEAVAAHASEFDEARLASIDEEMTEETTTRYWDSHPPDVDRIDNAEKQGAPGIYREAAPATLLFKDFSGWSQRATRLFYAEQGVTFNAEQLRSRDEIMGHIRNRNREREQRDRFFNGQFQEWPLLQLQPQLTAALEKLGWQACIDGIRARSPEIARHWSQALQAHEQRPLLRAAVKLGASSRQMGLPGATDRSSQELAGELENIAAKRMPFYRPLEEGFALYALRVKHAIDSMPSIERARATALQETLIGLAELGREASALEELAGAINVFGSIAQSDGEMPAGFDELEASFTEFALQLLARADRIPQSIVEGGTVGAYLRARSPDLPATGATITPSVFTRASWGIPRAFHHLYSLALGELVSLCEAAEHARGIRPIRLVA